MKPKILSATLRVLYMSGYTENVIACRGVLDDGTQETETC